MERTYNVFPRRTLTRIRGIIRQYHDVLFLITELACIEKLVHQRSIGVVVRTGQKLGQIVRIVDTAP
jgi:hypothetical protein